MTEKQLHKELADIFTADQLFTDELSRLTKGTDAGLYRLIPKAVVKVNSEEEVIRLLRFCNDKKIPVTFKAGGTSLSGQTISDSILMEAGKGFDFSVITDNGETATFDEIFEQLHGKEISYNNLLDIDAAVTLISDFDETALAILKHNNACGMACRPTVKESWDAALAADPVSAFGGIVVTNRTVDKEAAEAINSIFFEVIIAPAYDKDALEILIQKKNRIILILKSAEKASQKLQYRSVLNGALVQDKNISVQTIDDIQVVTEKAPTEDEIKDLLFANLLVKHTKSNAIVLAKNRQLIASGTGQTSRVDALKQAIEKAETFNFDLNGAVMASDAFFPFPDCVEIAHKAGITSVIQPGGSIRDSESVDYCNKNGLSMVTTGTRHFKH
jgi:phosphoribosylaminoimidazolecarboxamide formyltransferase/IMP cyclohydrolase